MVSSTRILYHILLQVHKIQSLTQTWSATHLQSIQTYLKNSSWLKPCGTCIEFSLSFPRPLVSELSPTLVLVGATPPVLLSPHLLQIPRREDDGQEDPKPSTTFSLRFLIDFPSLIFEFDSGTPLFSFLIFPSHTYFRVLFGHTCNLHVNLVQTLNF